METNRERNIRDWCVVIGKTWFMMINIILLFGINNVINPNSFSNAPFISGANYPSLSSETHRSLSVELAKRGEQKIGSAAPISIVPSTANVKRGEQVGESEAPFASFHRVICRKLLLKIINIALCFPTYHAVFPPISFCNWFLSTPSVLRFLSVIR